MTEECPARIDIFAAAEPTVTRIIPELAVEIGLNESIVLLQIAFWIKTANNCLAGNWWTFQSVRGMQEKAFGYMGLATINRTIKNLEDRRLITTGNFNKRKGDKTRWFALNPEGLSKLNSIKIVSIDESGAVSDWNTPFQNGTPMFQIGTPSDQNGTTLPETPTEITPKTTSEKKQKRKKPSPSKKKKPTPRKSTSPTNANGKESVSSAAATDEPLVTSLDQLTNYKEQIEAALEGLRKLKHTSRREYPKYVRRNQTA